MEPETAIAISRNSLALDDGTGNGERYKYKFSSARRWNRKLG
ncbi:MAG: hypothetical protein VKL59_12995 [Nostocaceae cyanobacterium]|nr:hypothetical protein [Nostocaceae cyanobacterium]